MLSEMLGYPTNINDGKYLTVLKSNNIYIFNFLNGYYN
jgi:hypothetical protein